MRRPASSFLLLIVFALVSVLPLYAQSNTGAAALTAIDDAEFPNLNVYLRVTDAAGLPIDNLTVDAIALTEDGQPRRPLTLAEVELGVQVVFVIDTSAPFKVRDANGVTRLEFIQQAISDFSLHIMRDGLDDVTLLTPEGLLIGHSAAGREISATVNAYTTEFGGSADPLSIVNLALDYAASLTPRPGMAQAVVLISNGFTGAGVGTRLADITARATAARVPIHTVFVGPPGAGDTASAQTLRVLSEQTQGNRLLYESPATFTPLFERLAATRTQYHLVYRSGIVTTGQHTLSASITLADGSVLTSAELMFPLRVEPPVVTLSGLSAEIQSAASEPVAVPFAVDFPDNHPRALRSAQLLVDGQVVSVLEAAPFEALAWPVAESATHTVQIAVTDELGLSAASEAQSVAVTMISPPAAATESTQPTPVSSPELNWVLLLGAGALLLAGLGLAGWWAIARLRPVVAALPTVPATPIKPEASESDSTVPAMPTLPKTAPLVRPPARPRPRLRITRPRGAPNEAPKGQAYFEVVEPGGGGAPRADIELLAPIQHLGRDAALAEIVFPDRSVSRRHARLEVSPEGEFRIFDEGSTSGTWVNFTMLPTGEGWELKHGDLVNLGRVQLRFKRRDVEPKPNGAAPGPTRG
jgi:hypothetical protein